MSEPNNNIGIRCVRTKDWSFWDIALCGSGLHTIAHGYDTDKAGHCVYISVNNETHEPCTDVQAIIRRLHRMLGVKKLNWEVVE